MASPQFHKFLELLKRNGPLTDEVKPESMRRNLDKVGGKFPEGVTGIADEVGGVPGEWIMAPGADQGAGDADLANQRQRRAAVRPDEDGLVQILVAPHLDLEYVLGADDVVLVLRARGRLCRGMEGHEHREHQERSEPSPSCHRFTLLTGVHTPNGCWLSAVRSTWLTDSSPSFW